MTDDKIKELALKTREEICGKYNPKGWMFKDFDGVIEKALRKAMAMQCEDVIERIHREHQETITEFGRKSIIGWLQTEAKQLRGEK